MTTPDTHIEPAATRCRLDISDCFPSRFVSLPENLMSRCMSLRSLCVLTVVSLLPTTSQAAENEQSEQQKPVHIVILSGQSNMAGMNPALGFVPESKALFPEAEVVWFKVARGGQPIRYWVPEWNEIAERHGLKTRIAPGKDGGDGTRYYQPILQQYQALLKKHPKPASVTFCWMQGERDAREQLSAAYTDALKQLIANLRRDLNQPEMNFVIGRLSDFGKPDHTHWQNVRKAQVAVAEADPRGAWVDCDDLNNKEKNGVAHDDLHYTRDGYELLGRRYVRQTRALIDGKTPAKDGRPE